MAAAPLAEEELRELCVDLCAALVAVGIADETPIDYPLPDDMVEHLHEREALAATLKTLPDEDRARLADVYREKYAETWGLADSTIELPAPKVLDERWIEELTDRVRVATLRDGEMHRLVGQHRDLPFGV
jgi:hypothetical protein